MRIDAFVQRGEKRLFKQILGTKRSKNCGFAHFVEVFCKQKGALASANAPCFFKSITRSALAKDVLPLLQNRYVARLLFAPSRA